MKKRELAATFEGIADAMGEIDVRERVERAEAELRHEAPFNFKEEAVEMTTNTLTAMALGYVAAMMDASGITQGRDEAEDPCEYALHAIDRMAEAYHNMLARDILSRLRELCDRMGVGE